MLKGKRINNLELLLILRQSSPRHIMSDVWHRHLLIIDFVVIVVIDATFLFKPDRHRAGHFVVIIYGDYKEYLMLFSMLQNKSLQLTI